MKMLSRAGRSALAGVLCLGLILSPVAHAVQLQIGKDIKMWSHASGQLKRVGLLKAGSTVDIPDQFYREGENPELALNRWLQEAGYDTSPASSSFAKDNDRSGYFFPIRVVRASPGSEVEGLTANKSYYMPIGALARDGDTLVVSEDAPLYPWDDIGSPLKTADDANTGSGSKTTSGSAPKTTNSGFEATANCPPGGCQPRSQGASFNQLVSTLQTALNDTSKIESNFYTVNANNMSGINKVFNSNCGIQLREFMGEVKRQTATVGIPPETLLSLMVRESGGKCQLSRLEGNGTSSVGLFQISAQSAKYPVCSASQKRSLKTMTLAAMQYGPACLENPVYNLKEAIRSLQSKLTALTRSTSRSGNENFRGFDTNKLKVDGKWTREAWRLAISAFNGGEKWVLRAKKDLEIFNSRFGTNLDPHNWEDLRVFYLRRHLDRHSNGHQQYFGNTPTGRREDYAKLNLAYTENIVPRDKRYRNNGKVTMTEVWAAALSGL